MYPVDSTRATVSNAKSHFWPEICVRDTRRHVYTWTGAERMQCENSRALRGSKLKAHVCEFSSQSSDSREETASHFAIYYTDWTRERKKFEKRVTSASMPDWPVFHSRMETASFVSMFYFRSSNVSYSRIRHV